MKRKDPVTPEFWSRTDRMGDCWLWLGPRTGSGYGSLRVGGRTVLAHRVAYELQRGLIPAGMQIDHLCRVRHCVNPNHMEVVTVRTNVLRGTGPTAMNARRQTCVNGHPFDTIKHELDRVRPKRGCRACNRAKSARYRERVAAHATP